MKNLRIRHINLLLMALLVAPLFLLASCSDSEQRMTGGDTMSKVILNLGGASASSDGRMAASAPSNITSVSITITGPGMPPMMTTDTTLGGTIELSVPAGPARLFAVEVTTIDGIYSGTAIAYLPAGATVSVPIIMESGGLFGFSNEGSIENPIVVPAGMGSTYLGSVGKGKSYYVTNQGSPDFLEISITGLTDDADLIAYGTEPGYTSMLTPNFGVNYIGKTMDETWNASEPNVNYYFVVDGSHTKNGARFVLRCFAHSGGLVGPPNVGTMAEPNIVPVGLPYSTRVAWDSLRLLNANYYISIVKPGTQYWINTYPFDPMNSVNVYQGPGFTNQLSPGTSTFTASTLATCFDITNVSFANSFTLEVVTDEGTQAHPIELYPDESYPMAYNRANYCMVGGLGDFTGSSYYRFPVTIPKPWYISNYIVSTQNSLSGSDINVYAYSDPTFETEIGYSTNSATSNESFYTNDLIPLDNGYIYVRVDDITGNGTTFVLDVICNGS